MTREPWDDWVKTCGQPTVWCGFDWPEIVENYVVLPASERAMKHIISQAMTREDDPLKQTPAAELDRDNRAMTREPEDVASVETLLVERELRAEIERLQDDSRMLALCEGDRRGMATEIERLRAALTKIADLNDSEADEPLDDAIAIARAALKPKP